jgi:hypothetical protein
MLIDRWVCTDGRQVEAKGRELVSVGKQCGENETMGANCRRVAGLVSCTVFLHVAVGRRLLHEPPWHLAVYTTFVN